jgi:predicted permease
MTSRQRGGPLALRLAVRCLPAAVRDEVLVELCEQHARIRARRGPLAASVWAWRQPLAAARASRNDTGSGHSAPGNRLALSLASLWRDVVVAGRRLAKAPFFTIFAVVTLALGIGATTGIYSIVHAALQSPPGIREVDEILEIRRLPLPDFEDYRARQSRLSHLSAWKRVRMAIATGGRSLTTDGELVSGDYFHLLGVQPALGRAIQPADDRAGAPQVIVLGHLAWQRLFDGRADAIGQTVSVNGERFVVVGVAPPEFKGQVNNGLTPSAGWVPLSTAVTFRYLGGEERLRDRDSPTSTVRVQGRLPPGTSIEGVQAEVTAIANQLDLEVPIVREDAPPPRRIVIRPWTVSRLSDVSINPRADPLADGLALAVMIAVGLVLLVACSNLANLVLARGAARRQEVTVRHALGASRWRLTREAAVETLLLALAGGAAGVGVARVLLVSIGSELDVGGGVLMVEPRIDTAALVASIAATLLAFLVAGVVPAWTSTRADVRGALAADNAHAALPRWRGRRVLITAQVAASVLLLALTTLFASQIRAYSRHESGLALDRLAVAHVDFNNQGVGEIRTRQIVDAVLMRLTQRPGIETAVVSTGLPVGPNSRDASVSVGDTRVSSGFVAATPSIFGALGVDIVRGRAFDDRDRADALPVAVINEIAARQLFGRRDVLGRQITIDPRDALGEPDTPALVRTIIGIASDTDSGTFGRRTHGLVFVPWAQQFSGRLVVGVRTAGDPADRVRDVRLAISAVAPDLAVDQIGTGWDIAGPYNLFAQISAAVSGLLGAFGMLLALVGLVGVLSHLVARRRREIGLRLALGATAGQAQRLILRDGLRPVMIGIVAGTALALVAQGVVFQLVPLMAPPRDLPALVLLAVVLLAAGALACYLPARRASRVDPGVALREGVTS